MNQKIGYLYLTLHTVLFANSAFNICEANFLKEFKSKEDHHEVYTPPILDALVLSKTEYNPNLHTKT